MSQCVLVLVGRHLWVLLGELDQNFLKRMSYKGPRLSLDDDIFSIPYAQMALFMIFSMPFLYPLQNHEALDP